MGQKADKRGSFGDVRFSPQSGIWEGGRLSLPIRGAIGSDAEAATTWGRGDVARHDLCLLLEEEQTIAGFTTTSQNDFIGGIRYASARNKPTAPGIYTITHDEFARRNFTSGRSQNRA